MKVIVAGGRDFDKEYYAFCCLNKWANGTNDPIEVVSGGAKGADNLGEYWANRRHNTKATVFKADWDKHGKAAGPIRNAQMAEYADALIAFWDGKSKGTKNMIDTALKEGLEVHVYRY